MASIRWFRLGLLAAVLSAEVFLSLPAAAATSAPPAIKSVPDLKATTWNRPFTYERDSRGPKRFLSIFTGREADRNGVAGAGAKNSTTVRSTFRPKGWILGKPKVQPESGTIRGWFGRLTTPYSVATHGPTQIKNGQLVRIDSVTSGVVKQRGFKVTNEVTAKRSFETHPVKAQKAPAGGAAAFEPSVGLLGPGE